MIYVVTGFPRSGTSMMMRCLKCAGVEPCVSSLRTAKMNLANRDDYAPNPDGWYEVAPRDYMTLGFSASIPVGRSVKIPTIALPILAPQPTTLIWMHRDAAEIRDSYRRAFPTEDFDKMFGEWPAYLDNLTTDVRAIVDDRRSIQVFDVRYADVIADPLRALAHLPLDVERLAVGVDAALYRNRAA